METARGHAAKRNHLAALDEFAARLPQWIQQMFGPIADPQAIDITPVTTPRGPEKYMLKGMEPVAAAWFGINPSPQGEISGKRCGISNNLGPTRRRALCAQGVMPSAKPWIPGLYKK